MEQRIARTTGPDGVEIAYAVVGEGPFLLYAMGWLTHLELSWALPPERAFYEALARGRTLVRYDKPGCGLSGPGSAPPSLETELACLEAVSRAVGARRFDLMGVSLGAAVSAVWASTRPETVDHLILYGGWVRGEEIATPTVRQHVLGLIATHWGLGSDVLADIFAPDADAAERTAFTRYQREASTPETAQQMLALSYTVDVEDSLGAIRAPALVLHRDQDRAAPLRQGELLAAGIPGARLEVLPGRSHLPYIGDADRLAAVIRGFLGLPPLRRRARPALTPRQLEVAALVTEGMTNREIADRLGIGERSAEGHVERIRIRLGFRSRSQIAAWFVASGGRS